MAETKFNRFAGINNQIALDRLSSGGDSGTDLATATNVDIDDSGRLKRRAGSTLISATATHSLYGLGDALYYRQADKLYRYDPVGGSLNIADTALVGETNYTSVGDTLYYCDGASMRTLVDGEGAGPYGIHPPTDIDATEVGGALRPGSYLVTATYLSRDKESGAPSPIRINVATGGISVTIPVSTQAGVTRKAVYLSGPGGETLLHAATVPNDSTTLVIGQSSFGVELDGLHKQPPPVAQVMQAWNGRMLIGAGSFILYSDVFRFDLFDLLRQNIIFDSAVTMIVGLSPDACVVGTEGGIYRLEGSDVDTARLVKLADYGVVRGAHAIADGSMMGDGSLGRAVICVSKQGLCAIGGSGDVTNLTGKRYRPSGMIAGSAIYRSTQGNHQALFALR